ncbi:MAG TPA: hypothetical protein VMU44_02090 [Steroidobacteraceae bacterium]|nr:hypothetical protein [Steroidobacteraceae bacterium]
MSVELLVILAASKAPDWALWNQALWDTRAPASLSRSEDLKRFSGFLPVRVRGRATGFEFLNESGTDVAVRYPLLAQVPVANPVVYSLSYGVHPEECAAVFLSAAVLVSRFDGIAFDPQQGAMLTLDQVNDGARQCLGLMSR